MFKKNYSKNTGRIFFLILVTILINSCCKSNKCKCNEKYGIKVEDCTPKHYGPYYLGEVKDYLYFKPGSWWVYKNNLSGETDSIYTIKCDTFIVNVVGSNKKWLSATYSDIACQLRSEKYNVTYYYDEPSINMDATTFTMGYVMERRSSFPTITHSSTAFSYPFSLGKNFYQLIPSLTIQGKSYTDVAVFQIWSDESVQLPTLGFGFMADAPTKYYWAKGVGLVLIEQGLYRFDTQTTFIHKWEIINYNLIK